ncbi:hypothetical protein HLB44_34875 [Aquincola sp. S2]|uniref:Uncharacterized protein n=1 Tax=Pseudaquabacterium terrae TaxID=2732868 RepID=A0ABX2EU52_9BURK|nr:hypothetical protein [Aquabacterium terrae]NRF72181.1 hypothetical protein [Aquabacterium terrae]
MSIVRNYRPTSAGRRIDGVAVKAESATVARPDGALKGAAPSGSSIRRSGKAPAIMSVKRTDETKDRLGRLRTELGKLHPRPSSPEEARRGISCALENAGLCDWTVPELSGPDATWRADGSVVVKLLAHVIVFNASGAFRIVDSHSPQLPYFEMRAASGALFAMPAGL